jgi:hypothetical protein
MVAILGCHYFEQSFKPFYATILKWQKRGNENLNYSGDPNTGLAWYSNGQF